MAEVESITVGEIVTVESTDALHDFSGPHAGKGGDFHRYWVIVRLLQLETQRAPDYVFVLEYVEDMAEFDSFDAPTSIKLYQLKKLEGKDWQESSLTGQSPKSKIPKTDSPVVKLLCNVRAFKHLNATGAFVSNARFKVSLASGAVSLNMHSIGLDRLDPSLVGGIKTLVAATQKTTEDQVDLSKIELQRTTLALDDLDPHVKGLMLEHLRKVAPEHVAQAVSMVEALFTKISGMARRTETSPDWSHLVMRRGYRRLDYVQAIESLRATPDKVAMRLDLFKSLSGSWRHYENVQVTMALEQCARDKVIAGSGNRWACGDRGISLICEQSSSDPDCFEKLCLYLSQLIPALSSHEIKALAIYEMTEWNLNPTRD